MRELKLQQARNLRLLITNEGTSQKELAERIGVSEQAVSNWAKGHTAIRKSNVEKIRKVYPNYSEEYLRGETKFPNSEREESWQRMSASRKRSNKSFHFLKFVNDYCLSSIEKIDEEHVEQWESEHPYGLNYYEAHEIWFSEITFPMYKVTRKQQSLVLNLEQWNSLVDEVSSYIDMRLTHAIYRGYW